MPVRIIDRYQYGTEIVPVKGGLTLYPFLGQEDGKIKQEVQPPMNMHNPDTNAHAPLPSERANRRSKVRYPIDCTVWFEAMRRNSKVTSGSGRTINISSRGILFETDNPVAQGRRIKIWVSWPAKLDHESPINLVLQGTVLRTEHGTVAVQIEHREFRTRGRQHSELFTTVPGNGLAGLETKSNLEART